MEVGGGETVESVLKRLDQKSEYAVVRGTCVGILFISLWALNLHVFKVAHIDISCIYPAKLVSAGGYGGSGKSDHGSGSGGSSKDVGRTTGSRRSPSAVLQKQQQQAQQPVCHPRKVINLVTVLVLAMVFCILIMSELLGQPYQHAPFIFYFLLLAAVIYPSDTTLMFRELALLFGRVLWLVVLPGTEIHFLEVLVGDILTSLSKVFFEVGLTCVATLLSLSPGLFRIVSPDIFPTLLASTPFILRIRQCVVQRRGTSSGKARFLVSLNILKYCSSIPGLWLPLLLAPHYSTYQIERVLLVVLLVNSLYSFLWDVIMDWGLGHVKLTGAPKKGGGGAVRLRHWGLRPTLLFGSAGSYYAAIGLDLVLRLVWVLKYVNFDHRLSYDKFMLLIECLEVLRRGIWSIYRIEWECLSINGGRKGGGLLGRVETPMGGGIGMVAIGSKRAGGNGAGNTLARDVEGEVDLERSVGIETESGGGEGTDVTTVLLSR